MTAELLVLQFVDNGKLTVDDAVQLLESLVEKDTEENAQDGSWDDSLTPLTVWIIQK